MTLFGFHTFDIYVVAAYLTVMLAIGLYFRAGQYGTKDYFLAGRSMGWGPIGLSLVATLLSALTYTGLPGESYFVGNKQLLQILLVWLDAPIILWIVVPLYYNLRIYTVYEYLELRFDVATRIFASGVFCLWRLLWLGGVIYAPCKVLHVAADLSIDLNWLLIIVGIFTTLYTFFGGIKAVIWTDALQFGVMFGGIVIAIVAIWTQVDGGPVGVWQTAERMGRLAWTDPAWDLTARWSVWAVIPHFFLVRLSFYTADQIAVQRFLTASSLRQGQRSFVLNCVSLCLFLPLLVYFGIALLAFYQQNPQTEIRPDWVVRRTNADSAHPVTVDEKTLTGLVSQGALLDPATGKPFASSADLLDPTTGKPRIDRLAQRNPDTGEWLLVSGKDELMPRFCARHLPIGMAGLIMAAIIAASMSSMDSGLNSLATLAIVDLHRRLGWGRRWLAGHLRKSVDQLDEHDEMVLARPLVLVSGLVATFCSVWIAQIDDIFDIMIRVVNTFGGPLLSVFLLAIFTRRATGPAVVAALLIGTAFTLWITFGADLAAQSSALAWIWPWNRAIGPLWPLSISVVATTLVGYLLSFVLGTRKPDSQLVGLVVGQGPLGIVPGRRTEG